MAAPGDVLIVRMTVADLPAVTRIEALSFPNPWPMAAYRAEIVSNPQAAYFVARLTPGAEDPPVAPLAVAERDVVAGYTGLWMQLDEAHISTIAVHPQLRRRRIGERLFVRAIVHALGRGASAITLEVRVSNEGAQRLYEKYGFEVVGRRRRYYSDNGEDALIMTTPPVADPAWAERFGALVAALGGPEALGT